MRGFIFALQVFLLWGANRGVYHVGRFVIKKVVVVKAGRTILAAYFLNYHYQNKKKYKKIEAEREQRKQDYINRKKESWRF